MNAVVEESLVRDGLRLRWASGTDVGNVRRVNEDAVWTAPGLYVVADGMGGHAAGDVASALVVDVCRGFSSQVPLSLDDVAELVSVANDRVRHQADADSLEGMGTTLVGLALFDNGGDDELVVVNVGDSRCYTFSSEGQLRLESHDHSVVQELVDAGTVSHDDARQHPDRHVVTRAIGIDETVAADFVVLERRAAQRILLCSDGVSGQLDEDDIRSCLADVGDTAAAVRNLLEAVLAGEASDNVSAIVVDVHRDLAVSPRTAVEEVTGPHPSRSGRPLIERVPATASRDIEVSHDG